ncbi:hypothetical protein D3C75_868240 [compost metagenome]
MQAVGGGGYLMVAIFKGVVGQDVNFDRRSGMCGGAVAGDVLHWRDGQRQGAAAGAAVSPVANLVGNHRQRAVPVLDRDERVGAIRVEGELALPGDKYRAADHARKRIASQGEACDGQPVLNGSGAVIGVGIVG